MEGYDSRSTVGGSITSRRTVYRENKNKNLFPTSLGLKTCRRTENPSQIKYTVDVNITSSFVISCPKRLDRPSAGKVLRRTVTYGFAKENNNT